MIYMKYEEVCKSLLSDFPDIEKWEYDSELSESEKLRPYYLAVCFICYLGRKFYQGELEIVRRGFSFIEKMFVSSDNSTKKLAKSGYLVNIYFAIKKGNFPDLFKDDKFGFVTYEGKKLKFKYNTQEYRLLELLLNATRAVSQSEVIDYLRLRVYLNTRKMEYVQNSKEYNLIKRVSEYKLKNYLDLYKIINKL